MISTIHSHFRRSHIMRKFFIIALILLTTGTVLWLTGCGKEDNTATTPVPTGQFNRGGTTTDGIGTTLLGQSVSITCMNNFKWSFTMSMDSTPNVICANQCKDLQVTVTATKGEQIPGFGGQICLQNNGAGATENLAITITLLKSSGGGDFVPVREAVPVDVSSNPVLASGATGCYFYAVNVAWFGGIDPASSYKIRADITITNFLDHSGVPFGVSPESPVISGCAPSNDCVVVSDVPGLIQASDPAVSAAGWNVTAAPATLQFCQNGTGQFLVHVCNTDVPYDETFTGQNTIVVGNDVAGTAPYKLSTVGCTPHGSGCVRLPLFYLTHAVPNLFGNNPDMVSKYLPIYLGTQGGAKSVAVTVNTQVVSIMKRQGPGGLLNGILNLDAQLLAAKLNMAGANGSGAGSNGRCIASTITNVDAFLATHNASDWASLSRLDRLKVLGWVGILEVYNFGFLCAPHCGCSHPGN
jgi:hypothetical protein